MLFLNCVLNSNADATITDKDRATIIKWMLERQLVGQALDENDAYVTDFELLMKTKGGIVLSAQNIKPTLVPRIPNIKLLVLNSAEIQNKADRDGDFMYLVFTEFKVEGRKVIVSLARVWAVGQDSGRIYMSGGAETYEFHKKRGKWVGRFLEGFIV